MDPVKILTIEDDEALIQILRLYLEKEGFTVFSALNAIDGQYLMEKHIPDVLLLDIHLHDRNGFELARRYREISDGVLIFITGEKTRDTVMKGFELGCDDYIIKPFDPPELIARIKANIRRSSLHYHQSMIKTGDLTLNLENKAVYKDGREIELFAKERMLLFYLAKHPNQVISAEQIFDAIWGIESEAELKVVLVYLSTLRKKIESDPRKPTHIQTVRGFGYKFSLSSPK
ncbi:DNA-binding response regulator [Bacillus sp. J14TS2]|uniref:response regulator transcription factor n=1 Tax=Bacillus sp. J14TS2 TaxID=2807188 RepID=UPI001B06B989|nr:response regulator transcription factor [Bacillus sp. J14TS2]GIN70017.1 DNA-binding response regulator [Bacillus sp. J14TS2]